MLFLESTDSTTEASKLRKASVHRVGIRVSPRSSDTPTNSGQTLNPTANRCSSAIRSWVAIVTGALSMQVQ